MSSTLTSVTVNVGEAPAGPLGWRGVLALEGVRTGDTGLLPRILGLNSLSWRDLPLPFMGLIETGPGGHEGARVAGQIQEIWREQSDEFGDDAIAVMGRGIFDSADFGQEVARLVGEQTLRGVSVDLAATKWSLMDSETGELVDDESFDFGKLLEGGYMLSLVAGDIGAATVAPMQAIEEAVIALTASGASTAELRTSIELEVMDALVASAPKILPRSAFERPEADQPTPLTLDGDELYGHAFVWDVCHTSFDNRCVLAPRSPSGYAYFHLGAVDTQEGDEIAVGQITLDTSHAAIGLSRQRVRRHYEETGVAAADVRVTDGRFGGWVSGSLRGISDETRRELKAAKLSGDWRKVNGRLELVGLLAVNVPGYPVPRPEARLVASGAEDEIEALVAAGIFPDEDERATLLAELIGDRELTVLAAQIAAPGTFRDYSAEERKNMAKKGHALPDGSFPIADCADAENAIRAQGRAPAGKQARVRTHIRKRVRALGCSGSIFDPYK